MLDNLSLGQREDLKEVAESKEVNSENIESSPQGFISLWGRQLAGEGYCLAYYHSFGLNTVVLRVGNVYDPRSKHKSSVVAKFIKRALQGLPLEIYGDGNQTRDFIYIDDLVKAIILASNAGYFK